LRGKLKKYFIENEQFFISFENFFSNPNLSHLRLPPSHRFPLVARLHSFARSVTVGNCGWHAQCVVAVHFTEPKSNVSSGNFLQRDLPHFAQKMSVSGTILKVHSSASSD
jgi:hypothetical protein